MSRGPENTFIGAVHRHLPAALYRMKNHNEYNGGIADVWYDGRQDLWVEYKFVQVPKRPTTVIDLIGGKTPPLSALQQEWLRARHNNGRQVGVIVGSPNGGVWFPGVSWQKPITALDFSQRLASRKALAELIVQLTGGPM